MGPVLVQSHWVALCALGPAVARGSVPEPVIVPALTFPQKDRDFANPNQRRMDQDSDRRNRIFDGSGGCYFAAVRDVTAPQCKRLRATCLETVYNGNP
jgi:hypothetical protein